MLKTANQHLMCNIENW